jgi:uncharacterized protein (TIGR02147 family)
LHLGLNSPSFFNWVIKGKRKLPEALIPKIAILFKLDDKECAFMHRLVRYNHSVDPEQRRQLFEELSSAAGRQRGHQLKPQQYTLFSKWYYLALRELLRSFAFKDDLRALAAALHPKITTREAREAIGVLATIGLIAPDEQGFYRPVEIKLSTGDVWESELIANLQMQLIDLGKKAVATVPRSERDVSNITISLSAPTFKRARAEITALRQKLIAMADADIGMERVYQCNIQFFPVSRKRSTE